MAPQSRQHCDSPATSAEGGSFNDTNRRAPEAVTRCAPAARRHGGRERGGACGARGEALTGRRVRRLLPTGRSYTGTVFGAAGRPDRLVLIHYDNGDVEELTAEDLADCLVPLPPRRAGARAPAPAAAAHAAAQQGEGDFQDLPRTRLRRRRGPFRPRSGAFVPPAARNPALLRRRPHVASPGKKYRGTTLCRENVEGAAAPRRAAAFLVQTDTWRPTSKRGTLWRDASGALT
jgi:hypothetical protein